MAAPPPAVEVDLCGHATLASAHILWERGHLSPEATARFQTRSGLLTARRDGDWIELNFPAMPPEEAPAPAGLLDALGVEAVYVGRNVFDYLMRCPTRPRCGAPRRTAKPWRSCPRGG